MAMMTLAGRMQVFGVVIMLVSTEGTAKVAMGRCAERRKSWAAVMPDAHALLKRRLGRKQVSVPRRAPNRGAGHSDGRAGLHIHE